MSSKQPSRASFPPINPYTPKKYPSRLSNRSDSPPPSAQPHTATPPHPYRHPGNTSKSTTRSTSKTTSTTKPTTSTGTTTTKPPPPPRPNLNGPTVLAAAQPTRRPFDPWNSSATGHQRAENRLAGSTSWRASRSAKLSAQWAGGAEGGLRVADTVGAGSEGFGTDGRTASGGWERGARGLRGRGQLSLWESVGGKRKVEREDDGARKKRRGSRDDGEKTPAVNGSDESNTRVKDDEDKEDNKTAPPQIFRNLTFYINGSTAPQISDHKLKHLLATHGAALSIALGRRTVTHVILGTANAPISAGHSSQHGMSATDAAHKGCGGGLAGGKLQKEITRVGGKGVKFVTVEWVLESVGRGRRLPESGYGGVKIAAKGQGSVWDAFGKVVDGPGGNG